MSNKEKFQDDFEQGWVLSALCDAQSLSRNLKRLSEHYESYQRRPELACEVRETMYRVNALCQIIKAFTLEDYPNWVE